MRRTIPVLTATAGGLVLLANFHTSPAAPASTAATGTTATPPPTSPTSSSPSSSTTTTTSASETRVVDGPVASNEYGDVQVRVTMQGGRIVDVQALQLPEDRSRSASISNYSGPILRREALQAQSAHIHVVSGATYTSESYAESLQGALDKANG